MKMKITLISLFCLLLLIALLLTFFFLCSSERPNQKINEANIISFGAGTAVVRSDGSLWMWGEFSYGGDAWFTNLYPLQISENAVWKYISVGETHIAGIKSDGSLWAWGDNTYGQVGNGNTDFTALPVQIGHQYDWDTVLAGRYYTFAITADGSMWSWGNNTQGQLGDGTQENRHYPVQIGKGETWNSIYTDSDRFWAIRSDGTLWHWGFVDRDPTVMADPIERGIAPILQPIQFGTNTNWLSLSIDWGHILTIKTDGTLWAWGDNSNGQLGHGASEFAAQPVQVGIQNEWTVAVAADRFSLAIQSDGSLWGWGMIVNEMFDIHYSCPTYGIPKQIFDSYTWKKIVAGNDVVLIREDRTLWTLTADETHSEFVLLQISSDTDWVGIYSIGSSYFATRSDGSLWAWGSNHLGRLGDGTTINRNTLTMIMPPFVDVRQ